MRVVMRVIVTVIASVIQTVSRKHSTHEFLQVSDKYRLNWGVVRA
jgi:hypothetical protein